MRARAAFTLIELLVVIAIIAVLAAMAAPVYIETKRSAQKAQCQSNLAQIAKAFEAYISDHNGCYPCNSDSDEGQYLWMGRYWRWSIKRYVGYTAAYDSSDPRGAKQSTHAWKSILRCPGDTTPGDVYDGTSYAYSAAFYHTPDQINSMNLVQLYNDPNPSFAIIKTGMVKFPTKKALIADWLTHTGDKSSWWSWSGSRNYMFADGHVVYMSAKKIRPAVDDYPDINLTRDGIEGRDIN